MHINKISLSPFDSKRWIGEDGIHTKAYKTHAIHNLGSSQSCRLLKSMNVFEKEKKDRVLFLRESQDQRKGRKHLALKRQQILL